MHRSIYILISTIMIATYGQTQDHLLSALEVMIKSDRQSVAGDEYFKISMKLINKRGGKRERQLEQFTKTDDQDMRSSLIKFLSPADIKGTGFLSIEHSGRDDDQWLYLPAFKKTRRISPGNESDYFVGTDFTFEDLNREDLEDFTYSFLPDAEVDGAVCYHILAVPLSEKKLTESGYSKREMLIRKENFVLVYANFYDKSGEKLKTYNADNIKKVGEKWRAYRMEMNNLRNSHKTILIYDEISLDQGVDLNIFTERYLLKE